MINSKMKKQLSQIPSGVDMNEYMQKQTLWMQAAQRRLSFISGLKGLAGREYSAKVAEYDRDNQQVFYV